MPYDYRAVVPTEVPPSFGVDPTQIEPTDAPRYTAGSGLRSLVAETLDLLPPAQNIVNSTPAAPAGEVAGQSVPEDDRAPDLIIAFTRTEPL